MANNRMYLTCLQCLNDDHTALGDCQFYLAKYYPNTGWYTFHKNLGTSLDDFFTKHKHMESQDQAMYGDCFTIVSESLMGADPMVADKRGILDIVMKAADDGKVGR